MPWHEEEIPPGTRPMAVYQVKEDHVLVLIPGKPPIRVRDGEEVNICFRVATLGPGNLIFEAIDG